MRDVQNMMGSINDEFELLHLASTCAFHKAKKLSETLWLVLVSIIENRYPSLRFSFVESAEIPNFVCIVV